MKSKVISIRLDDEDLDKLLEISNIEGVKRSNIIQRALKSFIQNYSNKQSDIKELVSRIDDLETKYNNLLNRVNILTSQIDRLRKQIR